MNITNTEFLLKKQRLTAVEKIDTYIEKASAVEKMKAILLKQNVLTFFLSLRAQESYEISTGQFLANKKDSFKNLQICLSEESDNLYCLWQELKYTKKYGSDDFKEKSDFFIKVTQDMPDFYEMAESLKIENKLNLVALEKSLNSGVFEKQVLAAILIYKNALLDFEYIKAQEMIEKIEKIASDYPDLVFMRTQLEMLTQVESKTVRSSYDTYKKICLDLNVNTVSKYYFDIDLCLRRLNQ